MEMLDCDVGQLAVKAMPEEALVVIIHDTTKALAALHNNDPPICHRDIKPANRLLSKSGHACICDFGISRFMTGDSYTHCGTVSYMSPELLLGDKKHPLAGDVWALGLVALQLMLGTNPWELMVAQRLKASDYLEWKPTIGDQYSALGSEFVLCCLRNVDDRCSSLFLVEHAWLADLKDGRAIVGTLVGEHLQLKETVENDNKLSDAATTLDDWENSVHREASVCFLKQNDDGTEIIPFVPLGGLDNRPYLDGSECTVETDRACPTIVMNKGEETLGLDGMFSRLTWCSC
jgi:serine/threonine protein kinase